MWKAHYRTKWFLHTNFISIKSVGVKLNMRFAGLPSHAQANTTTHSHIHRRWTLKSVAGNCVICQAVKSVRRKLVRCYLPISLRLCDADHVAFDRCSANPASSQMVLMKLLEIIEFSLRKRRNSILGNRKQNWLNSECNFLLSLCSLSGLDLSVPGEPTHS